MRTYSLFGILMAVGGAAVATGVACGGSPSPGFDGQGGPDGGPSTTEDGGGLLGDDAEAGKTGCVNLECQQVACSGGGTTTVSGTVVTTHGEDSMARNSERNRKSNRSRKTGGDEWGVMELARERPVTAAAVAAGAAAAGLFLWSRRAQISQQLGNLGDQIGEWTDSVTSGDGGMSETGGDNAQPGAQSGGAGNTGSVSGRGRARSTTPQATR